MRKIIAVCIFGLMLITIGSAEEHDINQVGSYQAVFQVGVGKYQINDVSIDDIGPYIKQERIFLPIRYVGYAIGLGDDEILWDQDTKTAFLVGETIVAIPVGRNYIIKGQEVVKIDVPAEITANRTMLPLRAVSEAFGLTVEWDAANKQVLLKGGH